MMAKDAGEAGKASAERLYNGMMRFGFQVEQSARSDDRIVGLRCRAPQTEGAGWLIVVQGETAEGRVVAFVDGLTLEYAWLRLFTLWSSGSLKWKEDKYGK